METATPTIAAELRLVVGRLARKVRLSETSGLTPSQLSALVTIDQIGRARLCDIATAEGREMEVKGWKRVKKVALIQAGNPRWMDLTPRLSDLSFLG